MRRILMNITMIMVGNLIRGLVIGLFVHLTGFLNAQVGVAGNVVVEGGAGMAGYKLATNQSFETSPAGSLNYAGSIGCFVHKNVMFLGEYENSSYFREVTDRVQYLGSNRVGLGLEYQIVNKAHFSFGLGMTVGGFNFGYTVSDSLSVAEIKASGVYQRLNLSTRFLFGKKSVFGIFLKMGIINNPMTLNSLTVNGEAREQLDGINISDYRYSSTGVYALVGLSFKISTGNKRVNAYF